MVLRKGTLALEGSQYRDLSQFSELLEFVHGLGIEDALSHVEQRALGAQQGLHGRFHVVRIRGGPPALHWRVGVRPRRTRRGSGNNEQHWTGTARAQLGERPVRKVGHEFGLVHGPDPFRHRLKAAHHVIVGMAARALRHPRGDDQTGEESSKACATAP